MTVPRRAQPSPTIRPWLLGAAFAFGVGLLLLAAFGRAAVTQTPPAARVPVAATPAASETWRPAVKVDWKKHPPRTQQRVDRLGQQQDCDGLADEVDAAVKKDRALAAYTYAWFAHASLCWDAYYQPTVEPS